MTCSARRSHYSSVFAHCFLPIATCLLACSLPTEADPLFSVVNLGSLGSGASMTAAVNNSSAAVGFVTSPAGDQTPVTFNGQANALGGIGQANGINDTGTIIGTTYTNGSPSVTQWSNGQASNPGGISGYGTSINNAGEVAGGMLTSNGQLHAFIWVNGNILDVGALTGTVWSSAYGINSSGEVVGTSMAAAGVGPASAFVSNGTTVTRLGTLGGASSYGMAINATGQATGSSATSQGYMNAFLSTSQGMKDLGTLGGTQSYAYGINDLGEVVGYSLLADNTDHAFIYMGGVLLDLNDLLPANSGWTMDAAYGINDAGDVVGTGTYQGQLYAVELMTSGLTGLNLSAPLDPAAVPEPGALLLTGGGLAALGALLWRRRRTQSAG